MASPGRLGNRSVYFAPLLCVTTLHRATPRWPAGFLVLVGACQFANSQSGNSGVFGLLELSQANDYFFSFWCFLVFLCFWGGVFVLLGGVFFFSRASANKIGFIFALSQAKPGIPALPIRNGVGEFATKFCN